MLSSQGLPETEQEAGIEWKAPSLLSLWQSLEHTYGDNGNLLMLQYHAKQAGYK